MFIILASGVALLLSVLLFFLESVFIKVLLLPFILFILVYTLLKVYKSEDPSINHDPLDGDFDELGEDFDSMETVIKLRDQNHTLTDKLEKERFEKKKIIELVADLCSALPIMKELAHLVIDKTEESAISLTENIFQISNKSSQVGNHIKRFLEEMFSGDSSLKNNIDILSNEMASINKLIDD